MHALLDYQDENDDLFAKQVIVVAKQAKTAPVFGAKNAVTCG
jgi:hypothetical protein